MHHAVVSNLKVQCIIQVTMHNSYGFGGEKMLVRVISLCIEEVHAVEPCQQRKQGPTGQ